MKRYVRAHERNLVFYEHGYLEKPIVLKFTEDRMLDRMIGGAGKKARHVESKQAYGLIGAIVKNFPSLVRP